MYEMNTDLCLAVELIKNRELTRASDLIASIMKGNIENAAVYNLLGAIEEGRGDRLRAGKFYRVAYYMDQTFLPATNNLSRVTDFFYTNRNIDYGVGFCHEKK